MNYLLPAGADGPLPEGVRRASSPDRVGRRRLPTSRSCVPWVVTVHAERAAAVYYDRYERDRIVPPPTPEAPRPSPQRDLRLTLARPLAGGVAIRAPTASTPPSTSTARRRRTTSCLHGRDAGRPCPTCTGPRAWRTPSAPPGRPGSSSWSPGRARARGRRAIRELRGAAGARYLGDIRGGRRSFSPAPGRCSSPPASTRASAW